VYSVTATGAVQISSAAAVQIVAGAIAQIQGASVFLGTGATPAAGVLTFDKNPIIDTISGAPHIPSVTVFAGP
jgi:hypothetical protein